MARFWFLGSTPHVTATVTDTNDAPIAASPLTFLVNDPTGTAVPLNASTNPTTGSYDARVTSPVTLGGVYSVFVSATVGSDVQTWDYTFTVLATVPVVAVGDLQSYLGLGVIDSDRATLVLASAQVLCESVVSPLPNGAYAVVLDVAARGYSNPTNADSEAVGPFPVTWGAVSGGLWLTQKNKAALRALAGGGGAFSIDLLTGYCPPWLPIWDDWKGEPLVGTL